MTEHIRFGAEIITFFDSAWFGFGHDLPHPEFVAAFERDPRANFERMFDGVVEAGLEGVELAPAPGGWETALAAYGSTGALQEALTSRGLVLTSSYSPGRQLIGNAMADPSAEAVADDNTRRHAQFLQEMGASIIVTGNIARSRFGNESPDDTATAADFERPVDRTVHERFAEQLNRLGGIAAEYDVRLAIHTDAYSVCSRPDDIATVMSLTDPATVQLCLDAGHVTLDGGDAVEVLRENVDRVATMHWKDCAEPLPGHVLRGNQKERHAVMLTYFRVLGSGLVNWTEWMEILRDNGWRGWGSAEIDNSPDPIDELRAAKAYFREHLASIYS
jgi:inosose dehydratase